MNSLSQKYKHVRIHELDFKSPNIHLRTSKFSFQTWLSRVPKLYVIECPNPVFENIIITHYHANPKVLFLSDINECLQPGHCSQVCINLKGSFKCECVGGYARNPHHPQQCKAMEGHASLLFAHFTDIRKISLDHPEVGFSFSFNGGEAGGC